MKDKDSIFGAEPERLRDLIRTGMDVEGEDAQDKPAANVKVGKIMERPGTRIGGYKLLKVLGEGGMGIVYLAEQEQLIRRRVALKIIKPGMDSKRVLARFESERQALALLDHPNIAQVHDAGTSESGRPYFVMEYVKGIPITEFCDQRSLSIEQRLRLFQQVCGALQHAHQKGIIHRDIKPSNILVTSENDQIIPKIIDFGVAKAVIQPLTDRTLITEQDQLLGTPEYMSPEQVELASDDIDTRSDIYSLGVLLYELLTGVLPFDSKTLRTGGIENIRRVIREADPRTPSTRLTKLGDEAKKVAESRRTEVAVLARCLHKELEWIPLKAMRKERSQRYRSASELSDDIENYLNGNPLIAGPPSTAYRVRKFTRRHKALVTGIAAVLVVLIAGIIISTKFAIEKNHAMAETQEVMAEAQAVKDFLIEDLFGAIDNIETEEVTASSLVEAFDIAMSNIEDRLVRQPLDEAKIRYSVGLIYRGLGDRMKSLPQIERAYEIYRQHLGPEDELTSATVNNLAWAYMNQGRRDDAMNLWNEYIKILQEEYGEGNGRALLYMYNIGMMLSNRLRYEDAEDQFNKTLELCERSSSLRVPFVQRMAWLRRGQNYLAWGRYKEAEDALIKAREIHLKQFGPEGTLECTQALVEVYREQGDFQKAQETCQDLLDTMSQILDDEDAATLRAKRTLGRILTDLGDEDSLAEAEGLLRKTLEIQRRKLADSNGWAPASTMNALAVVLTKLKNYEDAEILFEQTLEARQRQQGDDHHETLETKHDYGMLKMAQEQYQEAEILLVEAANDRIEILGLPHPHTQESIKALIELFDAWNEPDKAEQWRTKLLQAEVSEQ